MSLTFRSTQRACYLGYFTQALIINFTPLLYVTFVTDYGLTFSHLSLLIALNFGVQLLTDIFSASIIDRISPRTAIVTAHGLAALGMVLLALLPHYMANAFAAILIATVTSSIGGGLIEVLVSPILEACPADLTESDTDKNSSRHAQRKNARMSLLHSFYSWGQASVVLLSTLFFALTGAKNWPVMAMIWSIIPLFNAFYYARVPMRPLVPKGEGESKRSLFSRPLFLALCCLMICAGASELTISQWAPAFAEAGLGISKTAGNLLGLCLFAMLMGTSRIVCARLLHRFSIGSLLCASFALCIFSYLIIVLVPIPVVSLLGCGLCGLAVGFLWPGTFSLAARTLPRGGYAMFAILSCGGDIGCMLGPTMAGRIADFAGGDLKAAFAFGLIFPVVGLIVTLIVQHKTTAGGC